MKAEVSGNGPPGFGGFGDIGQSVLNYQEMVRGMKRLKDIETHVETDAIDVEKYAKELLKVFWDMFRATGATFEHYNLRFINMFTAAGSGGNGGSHRFSKGIMQHKVINNLWCVRA